MPSLTSYLFCVRPPGLVQQLTDKNETQPLTEPQKSAEWLQIVVSVSIPTPTPHTCYSVL